MAHQDRRFLDWPMPTNAVQSWNAYGLQKGQSPQRPKCAPLQLYDEILSQWSYRTLKVIGPRQIWHFVLGKSLAALLSPRTTAMPIHLRETQKRFFDPPQFHGASKYD